MGLLASAFLAITFADNGASARTVHYGRLAEGWVRSSLVKKGMTSEEVGQILGRCECICGSFEGSTAWYPKWGVQVYFGKPTLPYCPHVTEVKWYFYRFPE
jgi:hypothetical protein